MVEQEVKKTGLPADIADAVVQVESNYNPRVIGGVGEVGLMQIRPQTAAMLGFRGSAEDLAKPEVNIHYGVTYLSKAWRLANGDLCRTLMKYRAGHGEEVMTARSVSYCRRAKVHLAELGSPLAEGTVPPAIIPASVLANNQPKSLLISPKDVYAQYRQGTPAGQPGVLGSPGDACPRHQGADRSQMAPANGLTLTQAAGIAPAHPRGLPRWLAIRSV